MATIQGESVSAAARRALEAGEGILRLTPTWVPRSFLQPGRRIKLHPDDYYAFGKHRGGIDEQWFGSTTPAANENREEDEGLSYAAHEGDRFTLKDAVEALQGALIGDAIWDRYQRWPVYSKFFDNLGPIPHHMHQNTEQAALVGQEGKPESYYFPPQLNAIGNHFPYTFFGLEPGTTKEQVRGGLERWNSGDNGILDLSKAYRLKPETGWLLPPCILHAPGSLVTYEPQWGSDVFVMYQSLVEGRDVPWQLLVKDVPEDKHQDLDYLVDQLDWDANVHPSFKDSHYLEPIDDGAAEGHQDRWIVYGAIAGEQLFSAKELTVEPGATARITDNGASGVICLQGRGRIASLPLESPTMIRFGESTEDEVFISAARAREGYEVENLGGDCPLVLLRYFGPGVNPHA
ncbi:MAG: hypothetical protein QGD90_06035, partial [Candidatus Hydrogenedentes bacterium]|nr:hypothetical protein [Candidatus Hydrogenedentota bacterium]